MKRSSNYVLLCACFILVISEPIIHSVFNRPHVDIQIDSVNIVDSTAIIDVFYWDNGRIIDSEHNKCIHISDIDSLKREYDLKLDVTRDQIKQKDKLNKLLNKYDYETK